MYALYHVIYNLYFHPLAKFPGPKLYAITKIPLVFVRISGRQHLFVKSWHDKYGPYVRVAPGELSTIDPLAWRDVYGHKSAKGRGNFDKDFINFYRKDPIGRFIRLS